MHATQRAQSVTNGYFGGFIGKRGPGGALATRKCAGKLFTLRAKYKGKSKAAQLRAASARLTTDIEMSSTYRLARWEPAYRSVPAEATLANLDCK